MPHMSNNPPPSNTPTIAALGAAVMLVLMVVAPVIVLSLGDNLDSNSTPLIVSLIAVVVTSVPALISAAFSERASKDIRNGVVQGKVVDALEESGVAPAARDTAQTTRRAQRAGPALLDTAPAGSNATGAGLTLNVCTDPECSIPRKPGRPMHGPHGFRAAPPAAPPTPPTRPL